MVNAVCCRQTTKKSRHRKMLWRDKGAPLAFFICCRMGKSPAAAYTFLFEKAIRFFVFTVKPSGQPFYITSFWQGVLHG